MSEECCGTGAPRRLATMTRNTPPPETATNAPRGPVDACCGPDPARPIPGPGEGPEPRPPWWRDSTLFLPVISGLFLVTGYALALSGKGGAAPVAQWLALVAGAWTFVPGAMRRLARGRLGVGLLMTIAAIGAVLLGHVGEAAALAFLFSLAETLEDRAMDRAKQGLRALLSLIPDTARVARAGGDATVPVADVRERDLLVIGAGERVPTDGVVAEGRSSIDVSAVTGESIPVAVSPGDPLPAGSVNGSGSLLAQATADGADNSLTKIVALVDHAHARKGERARLADRVARPLVPTVLVVAALVALYGVLVGDPGMWVERALVVLVAASPCAMAIAVPVTVISAIGSASKFGVVIKSGAAFEHFGTITTVVFDKTGTLTEGTPQVTDVRPADGFTRDNVLDWAAALEATSTHPLGAAIRRSAPSAAAAAEVHEDAGHGITGQVGGHTVRVGNRGWLDPRELRGDADRLAESGMTVVVVEVDGLVAGVIGVRDELRGEAGEAVQQLHAQGIDTVMLTGDNARTANALAGQVGIDEVYAEQLPVDKADVICGLTAHRPTAMVGDGINDAPALATATVGIAMGATGSAAAVEAADIAFTGNDLRLLPAAIAHARRARLIMTANIVGALVIIIALFPLALFGVLGLAAVVLVHESAEVVVILNGARAARRTGAKAEEGPAR